MSSSVKFITITEFTSGTKRMIRLSQIRDIIPVNIPIAGSENLINGPIYHLGSQIRMVGQCKTRFGKSHEIFYSRETFEQIQQQIKNA